MSARPFARFFRPFTAPVIFWGGFLLFLLWLSPFLPLHFLCALGVVLLDQERPRLLSRVWALKLAQLAMLLLSGAFAKLSLGSLRAFAWDSWWLLAPVLLMMAFMLLASLSYFLVSPVTKATLRELEEDRRDSFSHRSWHEYTRTSPAYSHMPHNVWHDAFSDE